jgi:hypothetical protein
MLAQDGQLGFELLVLEQDVSGPLAGLAQVLRLAVLLGIGP